MVCFSDLVKSLRALAAACPVLAGIVLATAPAASAGGTLWTLTDGSLFSNLWGDVTASGSYTTGLAVNTSNIVVTEEDGGYTYDFTSLDWTVPSQIPAPPCVIAGGCPPPTPTYATFDIGPYSGPPGLVALGFEDSGRTFGGSGTLTPTPISGSGAPVSEPAGWPVLLAGLAGLAVAAFRRGSSDLVNASAAGRRRRRAVPR
jgi:hypothetical protein